jgi:hypothetical protein
MAMCEGINAALTQASSCKRFHYGSVHFVCHLLSPVIRKAPLVGEQAKTSPSPSPAHAVYLAFHLHGALNDASEGKAEAGLSLEAPSAPRQASWFTFWSTPPAPQPDALLQNSMAPTIASTSRSPVTCQCYLHVPLVKFQPPTPFHGSSGDPPQNAPKQADQHSTGSFDRAYFRDRLLIMTDLVFELRQEMADLNYRFQHTDEKVERCLLLLSSMQGALTEERTPEVMPREAPAAATKEGPSMAQRPMKTEHDHRDEASERDQAGEPAYEPTYIEEEPWPGDLPPMWPTYSPGV